MSKFKLLIKYITGGMSGVVEYLLGLLNAAIASIDPAKKEKIQAALNVAERVFAALKALQWLCPTKWQTAYSKAVDSVASVVVAFADLKLTPSELEEVKKAFAEAVAAWKAPDDETCV